MSFGKWHELRGDDLFQYVTEAEDACSFSDDQGESAIVVMSWKTYMRLLPSWALWEKELQDD